MKRFLFLSGLALMAVMACPQPAEANGWDWLQELNGPGPSNGFFISNFTATIVCSGTPDSKSPGSGIFRPPRDPQARVTCLYVDFRRFKAEEDDRFHPVDINIVEIGPSIRLHPAIEVGSGIGWISFSSRNPRTNQEFNGSRLIISFPRLTFKPLALIPAARFRNNADWGFFQMYFRDTIVFNDLSDEDFASKPGTEFSRRHQRVKSMGFIIDAVAAARLIDGWIR